MAHTVAEQIVEQLIDAGVHRIYGIVGDSLNPIVDAVRRSGGSAKGGIDWIHVRNEEAAAWAAGAESQLTGKLAVCAGSCGPGNLHLINGLYDAHRSRARVLAIASHIPTVQIGAHYFQETHPDRLFVECSSYRELVSSPAQAPRVFAEAIRQASSAPGVAVVTLPGDLAGEESVGTPVPFRPAATSVLHPSPQDVRALADAINAADTVAIFAGAGVEGAHDEVVALAEAVNAPIGHSLRGKDFIQHDNPYDVGMTGLLGYGAAHAGIHDAELLILLGTDFPYQQFLPSDGKTRIAQVDVDAAAISRRAAVDVPVHGDVAETLRQLAPLVSRKSDRRFLDRTLKKHEKIMTGTVGAYASNVASLVPIHPEYVASVLDRVAPEDTVFTTDTGMTNVWAARYLHTSPRRRALGSYLHGSMANALPQAIGAQLADPERPVVSMSGDGGLGMLLGELLTVKALELPLTVLVFNNSTLGMVKAEMLVDGLPDFGVDVPEVDYAALAASLGFQARRVTAAGDVEAALSEAIAHRGPSLVDVVTDPRALSLPPEITGAQIGGFALAMSKVVLNGGVGEAVAMARSNLRNIPRP